MPLSSASGFLLALIAADTIANFGCSSQYIGDGSCRECSIRKSLKYITDKGSQRTNEQLYQDYRELDALLSEVESLERLLDKPKENAPQYMEDNHHIKRDLKCDENVSAEEDVKVGPGLSGRSGEEVDLEGRRCVPPARMKGYLPLPVYKLGVRVNPWRFMPAYGPAVVMY